MKLLLLGLLLGGVPQAPPVKEAPRQAPPVREERPAPKKVAAKVVQRIVAVKGLHSHQCPYCLAVWSHGRESAENQAAHTCPNCRRVLPHPWYPMR